MMKRTRLKTIADRTRTDKDIRNYKSQRKLFMFQLVKMNRQVKEEFYANLDPPKLETVKEIG